MRTHTTPEGPSALAITAYLVVIVIAVSQPAYIQDVWNVTQASWSLLAGLMNALLGVVQHVLLFAFGF